MDINYYFIDNLHLFFNKPNLIQNKSLNGHPFVMAFRNKVNPTGNDEVELVKVMLELLEFLFKEMKGGKGGMKLEQIKEMIREKIKQIPPR